MKLCACGRGFIYPGNLQRHKKVCDVYKATPAGQLEEGLRNRAKQRLNREYKERIKNVIQTYKMVQSR